jgi:hypothetical protein
LRVVGDADNGGAVGVDLQPFVVRGVLDGHGAVLGCKKS